MKSITSKNVVGILALALVCVFASCSSKSKETVAKANSNESAAPPVEVATAPVVERESNRGVEVVGSFEAEDEVTVSSQASGNLDDISVDIGSSVARGQVIGRVDQRELKLKVDQALAA